MKKMTKANLEAAFAGESQAYMKYSIFAEKAEREGFPETARLFRAIAYAEKVHATNHFRVLGGINSTEENLTAAAGGENYEVEEMYPAFDAVANLQEEKAAAKSIHYAVEAEKIHEGMYNSAKASVSEKKDIPEAKVHVCPVCGHTIIGDAPDECPVCGLKKDKYKEF
ncbi:MAG: rubrerythrin family protein [Bacteroidota bacterium]|nr:rubrerythrin family protein [Bacteroidota bacterium]